jgi:riboflavin kinase / FMN adenylyltransferase
MRVAHAPAELEQRPRAVAVGAFDGVHRGHRAVLAAARAAGGTLTLVTFDPHPRAALGEDVRLLGTVERRLELAAEAGVEEALVLRFDDALAELSPEEFAGTVLRPIGTETVAAGRGFRFGRGRTGDFRLLRRLGFSVAPVAAVPGVSSTAIRSAVAAGRLGEAARLLGRPVEVEGAVVRGDARGTTLGFPTANLAVAEDLLVPPNGIYAGAAVGRRAAVSIGTNPTYGGTARRIEAFLLDFEGDLYGRRLVVELWQRLRDERAFASEKELVAQIARDVEATRAARRPT